MKRWSEAELAVLRSYAQPGRTVIQIQNRLWAKLNSWRPAREVLEAIARNDISKNFPPMKVGFYDIEATNLDADFGFMLNWYVKRKDRHDLFFERAKCHCRPRFVSSLVTREEILRKQSDLRLCKELLARALDFDMLIGHFSSRYDSRFIRSRCLYWVSKGKITRAELAPLDYGVIRQLDTWRLAKDNLKLHSNRQESLVEFYDTGEKTRLYPEAWQDASIGDRAALMYVREHCRKDVIALERNYCVLGPFVANYSKPL